MIKIVGGKHRSRKIEVPSYLEVPSKEMVREGIANALSSKIPGAKVLDLFAGSGALGIESLSRGASSCDFADVNRESIDCIKRNLSLLGETGECYHGDYLSALNHYQGKKYDIVFLDPPYKELAYYEKSLSFMLESGMLEVGSAIVVEYDMEPKLPLESFSRIKDYKYGKTKVKILWL